MSTIRYVEVCRSELDEMEKDAFTRCTRLLLLEYRRARRPKYPIKERPSRPDHGRTLPSVKNHSISSIADIVGAGNSTTKDKRKFPKELIQLLEIALKRVIMKQDPLYDDVQLRGTFGVFYAYYTSESFQKTVKDNRKIEDLILMFFSKATGELRKRLDEDEVKHITNQHVAKFVRLLLQLIKTNRLASSDSELVTRLSEYESKLLQNAATIFTSTAITNPESSSHTEDDLLSWDISDIPQLLYLSQISDKPRAEMQAFVETISAECTEERALSDLKLRLDYVQTQKGDEATATAFLSDSSYQRWVQGEIQHITQAILKLTSENPNLTNYQPKSTILTTPVESAATSKRTSRLQSRTNSFSSDSFDPSKRNSGIAAKSSVAPAQSVTAESFFFTPANPLATYRIVLQKCLTHDLHENAQPVREIDLLEPSILGRESLELLSSIRASWHITLTAHNIIFLDICSVFFLQSELHIEDLDAAFRQTQSDGGIRQDDLTLDLLHLHQKCLLSLNDCLFRDLYEELQLVYESKIDTKVLTVMDEHIYANQYFHDAASGTARMFDELEKGLQTVAMKAYRKHREEICVLDKLEVLHIVQLSRVLEADIKRYRKRYRVALLDVINIPSIYLITCLTQIVNDLKPLLEQCYRNIRTQNAEFAIEDMFSLYREMMNVHDLLRQEDPGFESPINIDLFFRPFVLRWLKQAQTTIIAMIPRTLETDTFTNDEAQATGELNSPSIVLLFKSFNQHLQFLRDLKWPDEYWAAKFITSLVHIFSEGIKEYSISIWQLFRAECSSMLSTKDVHDIPTETLQQRLIARAREAINKQEPVEHFQISSKACVQLNNIEWAKSHLDTLEHNVDSAALSSMLEKYEGPKLGWKHGQNAMFFVKVVSAQNLAACDMNGYSDPYTVLSDHKGRRIGKTRTMHTNLNPEWNETFEVQCAEPLWLAATVWDRDNNGEHDICGRCYFKLDPRYFEDQMSKDFYVDLDTQGILHMNITMETEVDESTFYFSRAFRSLHVVENDMSRMLIDRMTPIMHSFLTRSRLRSVFNKVNSLDGTLDSAIQLLQKAGFSNSRISLPEKSKQGPLSNPEMEAPIEPLMQYLDDNFRTLDSFLNRGAFTNVLSKLWDFVLSALENLLVPPLHLTGTKTQSALLEDEVDILYKWLGFLKDTFAGDGGGLPEEQLQNFQYHEILSIRFFYFDDSNELVRECRRMASTQIANKVQVKNDHVNYRRAYNLGTIKLQQDQKRARKRAISNSEDIMLRVLRLRKSPEARAFVEERLAERQRVAKRAVTDAGMTRQSTFPSKR